MMKKNYIEEGLYKQILQNIPICCVDIVVHSKKEGFLYVKRNTEPAKNQFWFVGGRVHKNELLIDAAKRKLKEEVGIEANDLKYLLADETIFTTGPFKGISTHSINVVFYLSIDEFPKIKLDSFHDEFNFFQEMPENAHEYIKKCVAQVKEIEGK